MIREVRIWPAQIPAVEEAVRESGGEGALRLLRESGRRAAYVHGGRHSLFWEFRLIDSFRWQAHLSGLSPEAFRRRSRTVAGQFGLLGLLDRPVEELTPAQRARADLAAALLCQPDVLVWEEPFLLLSPAEQVRAAEVVHRYCRTGGLAAVAVSSGAPGLGAWCAEQAMHHTRQLRAVR